MKGRTGITLVALVVTIIVLIILAGVSITLVLGDNGIITKAKEAKIEYEIAQIKEEIGMEIAKEQASNEGIIDQQRLEEILLSYGSLTEEKEIKDRTLTTDRENYKIKVVDIWNGTTESYPVIEDKSGANRPNVKGIPQKTYVTWSLNEEKTEQIINDTQTQMPSDWYDYDKGKWANIKTSNNGLEAYWVWIPRYEYVVPTSANATKIEVKFIRTSQTKADEGYTIHPAFTNEGNGGFGELEGIWVAKFEAVSSMPTENDGGGNNPNLKVQVLPNKPSWRNIEAKNIFSVCRKLTDEGEVLAGGTVDSHLIKNIEWGACAILSQSKYGVYNPESINGEKGEREYQIWNNSSSSCITGSVGASKDADSTPVYAYNSLNGPKASTTGTVYGVYDMAGGAWEYVATCLKGKENELEYINSKFDINNQRKPEGVSELNFIHKYFNLYDYRTSDSDYTQYIIGDATVEMNGWNGDYSKFANCDYPMILRGR